MTTQERLLAEVLACPQEDAPRLILADWLDEHDQPAAAGEQRLAVALRHVIAAPAGDAPRLEYAAVCEAYGQPERAEFCRAQCELAKLPEEKAGWRFTKDGSSVDAESRAMIDEDPRREHLRRREGELLVVHYRDWFRADMGTVADALVWMDAAKTYRRGFVTEVTLPLSAWVGERCQRCRGNGRAASWESFRRCRPCRGSGVTGRHGPQLVRAVPLESVTLSGMIPGGPFNSPELCLWVRCDVPGLRSHHIPSCLFNFLTGDKGRSKDSCYYYGDKDDPRVAGKLAWDDLSAACLKWAKSVE